MRERLPKDVYKSLKKTIELGQKLDPSIADAVANAMIAVNIGLGLLFNTLAILGGAWGILSPVGAAVFHNTGSVIVVLASASLALTAEPAAPATPEG